MRTCATAVVLALAVVLIAGCSAGERPGPGSFDPWDFRGKWEGTMRLPGNVNAGWVEFQLDEKGRVVGGEVSSGPTTSLATSGNITAAGLRIAFEGGASLATTALTVDGDTVTGAGIFTPPGGNPMEITFQFDRTADN